MSNEPNERVFQINKRVRDIVRKRLVELEDFCVSVAMEAYKDILQNEPDDPFKFLFTDSTQHHKKETESNTLFYEMVDQSDDEEEDGEEVAVTTREFHGKTYYTFIDDEGNDFCGIHERIIDDDNESEIGDLAGYVDTEDRFWEAVKENGQIVKYNCEDLVVPAKVDNVMRYPDLDFLKKDR
jgi:hypothetical protein